MVYGIIAPTTWTIEFVCIFLHFFNECSIVSKGFVLVVGGRWWCWSLVVVVVVGAGGCCCWLVVVDGSTPSCGSCLLSTFLFQGSLKDTFCTGFSHQNKGRGNHH